ncbi:MAG TPA: hypothetical protein VLJ42_04840 [Solirubrobacteraceae bacterium]|nr:hypothetical protein [Solirubrobacteraceae bacterium]
MSESRRRFLGRAAESLIALAGAGAAAEALSGKAQAAQYYTFCGHTYTTASCPHPLGLPRVDSRGFPLRPSDGHPIDDLGRRVDKRGRPIDESGRLLVGPDQQPLPPAPRTRTCLDAVPKRFGMPVHRDGSWYRCCGGHVRKLMDCCAYTDRRINGDAALTGYCYDGRKVFCVYYFDTKVPC